MAENQTALTPDQANWLEAYVELRGDFTAAGSPENPVPAPGLYERAAKIGASVIVFPDYTTERDMSLVLDPELAAAIMRRPEREEELIFRSDRKPLGSLPVFMDPKIAELAWTLGLSKYLLNMDGEDHREQKDLLRAPLLKSMLSQDAPYVAKLCSEAAKELSQQGGEFDVLPIVRKIPFNMVCRVLALDPESEQAKELLDLVPDVTDFDGNPGALISTTQKITEHTQRIIKDRSLVPEGSVVMESILGAVDKGMVTEDQASQLLVQIFLAGVESTEALLANIFIEKISGEQQSSATVPRIGRIAAKDVTLRDAKGLEWSFKAGERVMVDLRGIYHVTQDDELNFGRGAHACPGKNLAKLIAHSFREALDNIDHSKFSIFEVKPGRSNLSDNYDEVLVLAV